MISGVTAVFVLMMGLLVFAFYQRNQAQETARIATSKSLAAFALMEQEKDPELSLLLATKSVRTTYDTNETVIPLSNTVLHQSIIKSRTRLTLTGHDSGVYSAAYSPDGKRIVTGSDDKAVKVWDAKIGQELFTLNGHEDRVTSVGWSLDSSWILTASRDVATKVWQVKARHEVLTLTGHGSVTWSPDGKRIVTASGDRTAKVWDAKTGQELLTLIGHDQAVASVV